ncbi:hypothetical protein A1O3_09735 [Capronia epimyces CBS 606.96]|uniref:N-acetyltransferase domain-containing protein n=1 Tax=Capronia epimyces CBS 606.96 TaxID=1182542 RepID=W9XBC1_9EURO|nr:uncharacterized protein A1O3_09735 [Capronia epimyces CBS 606.96]EXJ77508.1 hypothetical protein A1O3_09735 [Capronia epimyces CBS 606.96]
MPLRLATFSDIGPISKILAASFYDEELNDHIFPFRKQYPHDYLSVWKQKTVTGWWDYSKVWVVWENEDGLTGPNTTSGTTITGVAQWGREGEGSDRLWGLVRWWDPRRLISPFLSFIYTVRRFFIRNRSVAQPTPADPNPLNKWNFGPRLWPFTSHYFTHPAYRRNHWELCTLAVDPAYQRRGIGQQLVAWGLERARTDGLPAVVIGATDTEPFYQRCGFKYLVGYASKAELEDEKDLDSSKATRLDKTNPLNARGLGGGAIMWTELRDEDEK